MGDGTPNGAARAYLDVAVSHSSDDCLPWPYAATRDGYGQYLGRHAHTVVLEMFTGRPAGNMVAAHAPGICHNRLCVNPAHLRWATRRENTDDRRLDGTWSIGSVRRLTRSDAQSILDDDRPMTVVAAEFGVSYHCVYRIKRRRSWRHLQPKAD